MPAEIMELAKEYKIMHFPVDGSHTDMLYRQFKYIAVEVIQPKASGGKRDLKASMLSRPCSFSSQEIKFGGWSNIDQYNEPYPNYVVCVCI